MSIQQLLLSIRPLPEVKKIFLTTTGANNWIVPDDWNSNNNTIEVIAGGASGAAAGATNYAGSGTGGGYSKIVNQTLTPSSSIPYYVGAGGASVTTTGSGVEGNPGQDTYYGHASYTSA